MTQTLESFIVRSADRFDYATFIVLQRHAANELRSGYYLLAIESSYGNGYAYAWGSPGSCFYSFLIRQLDDPWYVAGKMCQGEQESIDWEASAENIRRHICEQRRRGDLSREEARQAWPEALFESETCYSYWCREQEALSETWELLVSKPGPRYRDFMALHKAFWPAFCEQLQAAKAKRDGLVLEVSP